MREKYLIRNDRLIDLRIKDESQIEIKLSVKGGADFY